MMSSYFIFFFSFLSYFLYMYTHTQTHTHLGHQFTRHVIHQNNGKHFFFFFISQNQTHKTIQLESIIERAPLTASCCSLAINGSRVWLYVGFVASFLRFCMKENKIQHRLNEKSLWICLTLLQNCTVKSSDITNSLGW